MKTMVTDDAFLEKEDRYILDRMKEFLLQEGPSTMAISKQILALVERAVSNHHSTSFSVFNCYRSSSASWRDEEDIHSESSLSANFNHAEGG